jgi:hypothetical protein
MLMRKDRHGTGDIGSMLPGLVDEYRLFVYPTIIGRGRRLFESDGEVTAPPGSAALATT